MMDDDLDLDNDDDEEECLNDEGLAGSQSDTDANISMANDSEKIDSMLIKKILIEMKSEFARGVPTEIDVGDKSNKNEKENEDRSRSTEPKQDSNFPTFKVSDIIDLKKFGTTQDTSDDEELKTCDSNVNATSESECQNTVTKTENQSCNDTSKCASPGKSTTISKTDIGEDLKHESGNDSCYSSNSVKLDEKNSIVEPVASTVIEPKRKRSLRNQNSVANVKDTEDDNIVHSGVKRSSRRFSKDKCESVLQNAIARKEKSFSSLSSSEERNTAKRCNRSSRRSSSSNNGCGTPSAVEVGKVSSSHKSSGNRTNSKLLKNTSTVLPASTSPSLPLETNETQLKISKSTNYDEKLQNTINQLKSTIEHNDVDGACDIKIQENLEVPIIFDSAYNKTSLSLKVEQEEEIESSIGVNIKRELVARLDDCETVSGDKDMSKLKSLKIPGCMDGVGKRHRLPIKRKTRYFKGLKYTIKGGHVKSSSRTLSARIRKCELDQSRALEGGREGDTEGGEIEDTTKQQEVKELLEDETRQTDEREYIKGIDETIADKTEDTIAKSDSDITKKMLSIFGVSRPSSVRSFPESNEGPSENEVLNADTNEACDIDMVEEIAGIVDLKRKLSLTPCHDYSLVKRSHPGGHEFPDCGEIAPTTKDSALESLPDTVHPSLLLTGVFTESVCENEENALCLCNSNNIYYASRSCRKEFYCQAIDSLDGRLIGCCNTLDVSAARLVRSSVKLPYIVVCDVHHQRMQRHNSCPGCGAFCTQGIFVQCRFGHHFHKDCQESASIDGNGCSNQVVSAGSPTQPEEKQAVSGVCLHCGSSSFYDVNISLGAHKYPVFFPLQNPPKQIPSARMSFTSCHIRPDDPDITSSEDLRYDSTDDGDKSLLPAVGLILPSGLKISSDGLPDASLKDKLDKLLHVACTVTTPSSGRSV